MDEDRDGSASDMWAALEELRRTDPLGARAIELRYFEGSSWSQVAEELGLSTDETRMVFTRAMFRLGGNDNLGGVLAPLPPTRPGLRGAL